MSYFAKQIDTEIVRLIKFGGIGLLPADTIYGLSCLALNRNAVERIYRLKRRDENKAVIVLVANASQTKELGLEASVLEPARKYWPGPLTLKLAAPQAPKWLTPADGTLALRLPADRTLRDLLTKTGPLVSTSANFQGEDPTTSVNEAKRKFGKELDFYVDTGSKKSAPSTIAEVVSGKLRIVRQGKLKVQKEDLYEV